MSTDGSPLRRADASPGRPRPATARAQQRRTPANSGSVRHYLWAAAALFLALAAAVTAFQEMRPFFVSGPAIDDKIAALTVRDLAPGPSERSHRAVLDDCYYAMHSVPARAAPSADWQTLVRRCADLAAAMTGAAPANAYAWLVGAVAAAEAGDLPTLNRDLWMARATAPSEAWLAQLRVELAEAHFADLAPETRDGHRRDLELLVASDRGLPGLVERYLEEPGFRTRMTGIVEDMPAAAQRRFIDAVRRHADGPAP